MWGTVSYGAVAWGGELPGQQAAAPVDQAQDIIAWFPRWWISDRL